MSESKGKTKSCICPWCNHKGDHEVTKEDSAAKTLKCVRCEKEFFDRNPRPLAEVINHRT